MKTYSSLERQLNILSKAVYNGMQIDQSETFESIIDQASEYLFEGEFDKIDWSSPDTVQQYINWVRDIDPKSVTTIQTDTLKVIHSHLGRLLEDIDKQP